MYQIRDMLREDAEKDLIFDGFVVLSCPLKHDSMATIKEIKNASHYVQLLFRYNCYLFIKCNISKNFIKNSIPFIYTVYFSTCINDYSQI